MIHMIRRTARPPRLDGTGAAPEWDRASELRIATFHPKSSDHRPVTRVGTLYDDRGLYVRFRVDDRYVVSRRTCYQDSVCKDSCVEFFIEPPPRRGYFNFEMNCGGTLLLYYIEDPTIVKGGFAKHTPVDEAVAKTMTIAHSMPAVVQDEIADPVEWTVECFIPFAIFERYVGPLGTIPGSVWRGNFYKCGSDMSHPHWAMWSPIGNLLSFHQPRYFAPIVLEPARP